MRRRQSQPQKQTETNRDRNKNRDREGGRESEREREREQERERASERDLIAAVLQVGRDDTCHDGLALNAALSSAHWHAVETLDVDSPRVWLRRIRAVFIRIQRQQHQFLPLLFLLCVCVCVCVCKKTIIGRERPASAGPLLRRQAKPGPNQELNQNPTIPTPD